jgi:hypothetical protein
MKIEIDYVVPMVFPEDRKWQADLDGARGFREKATGEVRYRSWGTEELLIRCICKNLPWIRTIHVILARPSQVQPWMEKYLAAKPQDTLPRVRVVFHKDIMPREVLPTFNSRAIEMYLHRIPGLADYFLYGNDDMFPIAPMGVEEFFRPDADASGTVATLLPCLHYREKAFNPERAFQVACMNGLNFVASHFDKHFDDHWLRFGHNTVPMVKATCELFWQRWPKQMQASVTRFRLPKNFNQYIYSWHQILSGQYIDHRAPRTYLSVDADVNDIIQAIRTADGLLCINDNTSVNDITNLAATIRSEIMKRL